MVRSLRQNGQGAWQAAATYLAGPRGMEYRRDDLTGQIRWYVYDGLGSVVGELDPSGNLTAGKKYDVYGAERVGGTGTATSRQGFCGSLGHIADAETGLVYMRARYYDPNVGRFVSEDPARSGDNWYEYCGSNPANFVDKTGKVKEAAVKFDIDQYAGWLFNLGLAWMGYGVAQFAGGIAMMRKGSAIAEWGYGMLGQGLFSMMLGVAGITIGTLAQGQGGSNCLLGVGRVVMGAMLILMSQWVEGNADDWAEADTQWINQHT